MAIYNICGACDLESVTLSRRIMEKWSLAAFMILWNFNSIESGELCQGIDGQGELHVQL